MKKIFAVRANSNCIGGALLVAVSVHLLMLHDPFVNPTGGSSYELASVYFTIALFFVINGPGKFSLDRYIFGTR